MSAITTPFASRSDTAPKFAESRGYRSVSNTWLTVPAGDCATSRYSAESTDVLAGNVTHAPSANGSIDAYAPTASVSCDASAELHGGALGPVASWPHAAVATSAQLAILAAVRCFIPNLRAGTRLTLLRLRR